VRHDVTLAQTCHGLISIGIEDAIWSLIGHEDGSLNEVEGLAHGVARALVHLHIRSEVAKLHGLSTILSLGHVAWLIVGLSHATCRIIGIRTLFQKLLVLLVVDVLATESGDRVVGHFLSGLM